MAALSEGLELLHLIHTGGGCNLSEIAVELGIPKSSVLSWISMFCSTGYLKRIEKVSTCRCRKSGMRCVCCHCSCDEKQLNETRIELTECGVALIRRKWNEKTGAVIISGNI